MSLTTQPSTQTDDLHDWVYTSFEQFSEHHPLNSPQFYRKWRNEEWAYRNDDLSFLADEVKDANGSKLVSIDRMLPYNFLKMASDKHRAAALNQRPDMRSKHGKLARYIQRHREYLWVKVRELFERWSCEPPIAMVLWTSGEITVFPGWAFYPIRALHDRKKLTGAAIVTPAFNPQRENPRGYEQDLTAPQRNGIGFGSWNEARVLKIYLDENERFVKADIDWYEFHGFTLGNKMNADLRLDAGTSANTQNIGGIAGFAWIGPDEGFYRKCTPIVKSLIRTWAVSRELLTGYWPFPFFVGPFQQYAVDEVGSLWEPGRGTAREVYQGATRFITSVKGQTEPHIIGFQPDIKPFHEQFQEDLRLFASMAGVPPAALLMEGMGDSGRAKEYASIDAQQYVADAHSDVKLALDHLFEAYIEQVDEASLPPLSDENAAGIEEGAEPLFDIAWNTNAWNTQNDRQALMADAFAKGAASLNEFRDSWGGEPITDNPLANTPLFLIQLKQQEEADNGNDRGNPGADGNPTDFDRPAEGGGSRQRPANGNGDGNENDG